MHAWISEMSHVVLRAVGNPNGVGVKLLLFVVAGLTVFMVFRFMVGLAGASHFGSFGVWLALGLGLLALVAGVAGVVVFLLPAVAHLGWASWSVMPIPIVVMLVVGVPLQCLVLRTAYLPTALAFGISLLVMVLMLSLTRVVIGSVSAGAQDSARLRAHNDATAAFIGR